MMNTFRSALGYLATLITRYTPFDLSRNSLEGIFNFLPIRDSILTSGQPTESQFRLVRDAGIKRVINLAPHDAENSLADEGATLNALGMEYVHIPVDFRRPTEEDFEKFCVEMGQLGDEPVLVHCAANMRVSAFMFRYRRDILGEDPKTLAADLDAIWKPFGVWERFLSR